MCTDIDVSIASHVVPGLLARIADTLHIWRERQMQRRELARWTERDLHDVGLGWAEVIHEAEKPFWRP
jgi:uncharacterized protein YjiS (DUF1127 family)